MNYHNLFFQFLGGRNFSSQTCLHFKKLVHGIVSNDGMLLLLQTAQSSKLQKSSYMYRFSQGSPCSGCWGRSGCGVTSHTYLKLPKLGRKEPNANCSSTKLPKSSYMYSFSQGGPGWGYWGGCGYLKTPKLWRLEPNSNWSMYKASEECTTSLVSHRGVPAWLLRLWRRGRY